MYISQGNLSADYLTDTACFRRGPDLCEPISSDFYAAMSPAKDWPNVAWRLLQLCIDDSAYRSYDFTMAGLDPIQRESRWPRARSLTSLPAISWKRANGRLVATKEISSVDISMLYTFMNRIYRIKGGGLRNKQALKQ